MSLITTNSHLAGDLQKIRSPGRNLLNGTDAQRLDCYLTVLEDNRKAARFLPNDATLAMDMACFVCDRLQGRTGRPTIPTTRLTMTLLHSETDLPAQ